MWIWQVQREALELLANKTPSLLLASQLDGAKILWANESFCQWSGYTLGEIQRKTWVEISVQDNDLDADLEMARQMVDGKITQYRVQKKYVPKNGRPEAGNLSVLRYPETGPMEFCWCRWEPRVDETSEAFEIAIETQTKMTKQMTELAAEVKAFTTKTEEETFLLSVVRMSMKHPKIAVAILVSLFALSGADAVLNTLQRLGLIQPPPVTVQEIKQIGT